MTTTRTNSLKTKENESAILHAVKKKQYPAVTALLNAINVNELAAPHSLYIAALSHHDEKMINILLQHQVKTPDDIYHRAVNINQANILRLLFTHNVPGASHKINGVTALHEAARKESWPCAKAYVDHLEHNILNDSDDTYQLGYVLFKLVILKENLASIKRVLSLKPNLNWQLSSTQNSVLHCAAEQGRSDVAVMLIQAGANPNAMNKNNETPLQLAARCKKWDCVTKMSEAIAEKDAAHVKQKNEKQATLQNQFISSNNNAATTNASVKMNSNGLPDSNNNDSASNKKTTSPRVSQVKSTLYPDLSSQPPSYNEAIEEKHQELIMRLNSAPHPPTKLPSTDNSSSNNTAFMSKPSLN